MSKLQCVNRGSAVPSLPGNYDSPFDAQIAESGWFFEGVGGVGGGFFGTCFVLRNQ